jgi:formylglycine-generating enzyme required for sulfatase activity
MKTLIQTAVATLFAASAAHAQGCVGDVAVDGRVDGGDLGVLLANWGPVTSTALSRACDFDNSGQVDGADLGGLLAGWGACPPAVPAWATLIEALPDPSVVTDQALRAAITASGLAWRVRDTGTGIEMLLVPPGTFQMGCSPSLQSGCQMAENPIHFVTITSSFYLGRFEVTQSQWQQVAGGNPSFFTGLSDSSVRPVERVSLPVVHAFLQTTGLRLPTEAEWEYACRAGTQTAFHGTSTAPSGSDDEADHAAIAWTSSNSGSQTHPVGTRQANGLGFFDMLGNVLEWTGDRFSADYYASSPAEDPLGPSVGSQAVMRGGAWLADTYNCRTSSRWSDDPMTASNRIGFRVARNP